MKLESLEEKEENEENEVVVSIFKGAITIFMTLLILVDKNSQQVW